MEIYKAKVVKEIIKYYGHNLLPQAGETIHYHLNKLARKLKDGLSEKREFLLKEVNNYHPKFLGKNIDDLMELTFDLTECQETMAREYGFQSWKEIQQLKNKPCDIEFEECLSCLLSGDSKILKGYFKSDPTLAQKTSPYGHKATLLHYTASNGVEMWRQQVPLNLQEIISILLENGANKNDKMKVYGGNYTAFDLFITSTHPIDAGIDVRGISDLLS